METVDMKPLHIYNVEISDIKVESRIRDLSFSKVQELAESIEMIGLLHPIVISDDYRLILGNHRLSAFKLLGKLTIPCQILSNSGMIEKLMEIDENLINNPLNVIEMGEHLIEKEKILIELGINSKRGNNRFSNLEGITTIKDLARDLKQSVRSVHLKKQIVSNLSFSVKKCLVKTKYANQTNHLYELSKLSHEEQEYVIDHLSEHKNLLGAISDSKRNTKIQNLKNQNLNTESNSKVQLYNTDFTQNNSMIKNDSVSLIFTDPPYITEDSLFLYEQTANLGKRVLVDGGICIVYTYQPYMVDVIKAMEKHLTYQWIIAITQNVSDSHNYWKSKYEHTKKGKEWKISWKPLLVFSKGDITNTVNQLNDSMQSVREKDFHEWQQSIAVPDYFLPSLSMKNEIVLDPMAGTGTTGVSALKNGLKFIGIEKDKNTFNIMQSRINSL